MLGQMLHFTFFYTPYLLESCSSYICNFSFLVVTIFKSLSNYARKQGKNTKSDRCDFNFNFDSCDYLLGMTNFAGATILVSGD